MINIEQLIKYDKELFFGINGGESLFWDGFMWVFTSTFVWIPLAIVLLYVIFKNNTLKHSLFIILMIGLVILLADRGSSGVIKPFFERFRPTQDSSFMSLVDIVNGYRGGKYGFISSHAANSFGVFTFIALLLQKKELSISLFFWAILTSYSRIYLGVHYPSDIFCGALFGALCGYLVYLLYNFNKRNRQRSYRISSEFTSTKYLVIDINIILNTLFLTYLFIFIWGMIISTLKNF